MQGPSIAAVIPVHNRADLLQRLLATIRGQTTAFTEVIAVDNASADGALAVARAHGCTVIEMGENAGFARAVNRGARSTNAEWIAILNTDVELDPRWLEHLLAAAGAAGFVTGTILDAAGDARVDGTYDLVSRAGCAWRAGHGEPAAGIARRAHPIAIAPGTACLFRREAFERLHGFDEGFGSYLEDVDLGLRCVSAGIGGLFVPDALAWHHGSATFGKWDPRVVRCISRNQLLLIRRHYDRALFRACLWPILAGQLLWGLVALRHGSWLAWLAGKLEALWSFRLEGNPSTRLRDFLAFSESEIRSRARDPYWRWYCRLTSPTPSPAIPERAAH